MSVNFGDTNSLFSVDTSASSSPGGGGSVHHSRNYMGVCSAKGCGVRASGPKLARFRHFSPKLDTVFNETAAMLRIC